MSLKRIIAFIMLVVMAVSCAFAEEPEELTHDVCAVVAVAKVKDWDTDTLVTSDTTKLSFTDLAGAIIKLDFAKIVQIGAGSLDVQAMMVETLKTAQEDKGYKYQVTDWSVKCEYTGAMAVTITFTAYVSKNKQKQEVVTDEEITHTWNRTDYIRDAATGKLMQKITYTTDDANELAQYCSELIEIYQNNNLLIEGKQIKWSVHSDKNETIKVDAYHQTHTIVNTWYYDYTDADVTTESPIVPIELCDVRVNIYTNTGVVHWGYVEGDPELIESRTIYAATGYYFNVADEVALDGYNVDYVNNPGNSNVAFYLHSGTNYINVYVK